MQAKSPVNGHATFTLVFLVGLAAIHLRLCAHQGVSKAAARSAFIGSSAEAGTVNKGLPVLELVCGYINTLPDKLQLVH